MGTVQPSYTVGLDLGQSQDYTAIAVFETPPVPGDSQQAQRYDVRHLERVPLGTSYPAIVERVAMICERLPRPPRTTGPRLVVDATGVGRPVVDLLRAAPLRIAKLVPVLITGGSTASYDQASGFWHIPKRDLASTLAVLLQTQRLRIAKELPEAQTLTQELLHFKVKITVSTPL